MVLQDWDALLENIGNGYNLTIDGASLSLAKVISVSR